MSPTLGRGESSSLPCVSKIKSWGESAETAAYRPRLSRTTLPLIVVISTPDKVTIDFFSMVHPLRHTAGVWSTSAVTPLEPRRSAVAPRATHSVATTTTATRASQQLDRLVTGARRPDLLLEGGSNAESVHFTVDCPPSMRQRRSHDHDDWRDRPALGRRAVSRYRCFGHRQARRHSRPDPAAVCPHQRPTGGDDRDRRRQVHERPASSAQHWAKTRIGTLLLLRHRWNPLRVDDSRNSLTDPAVLCGSGHHRVFRVPERCRFWRAHCRFRHSPGVTPRACRKQRTSCSEYHPTMRAASLTVFRRSRR